MCRKQLRWTASIKAGRADRTSCVHRERNKLAASRASIHPTPLLRFTHVPTNASNAMQARQGPQQARLSRHVTHPNLRQWVETRRVAGVDSDVLSESTGHELTVVAGRDAAAGLGRRLHFVRDGMRGLACPPPEGNQGLLLCYSSCQAVSMQSKESKAKISKAKKSKAKNVNTVSISSYAAAARRSSCVFFLGARAWRRVADGCEGAAGDLGWFVQPACTTSCLILSGMGNPKLSRTCRSELRFSLSNIHRGRVIGTGTPAVVCPLTTQHLRRCIGCNNRGQAADIFSIFAFASVNGNTFSTALLPPRTLNAVFVCAILPCLA